MVKKAGGGNPVKKTGRPKGGLKKGLGKVGIQRYWGRYATSMHIAYTMR
jgi:hypothetical protein